MKDLVTLRDRDDEEINSFLIAKGWAFDGVYKTTLENINGGGRWIYKNRNFPMGSSACFVVSTNKNNGKKQVLYMTFIKNCYDVVKARINTDMIQMSTNAYSDCIETTYSGPSIDYSCRTGVCKIKESIKPLYRVVIQ